MGPFTAIYLIDKQSGRLDLLHKVQTDFKAIDPSSNCCKWSIDNKGLAVGGDDSVIRVF
jgi:hypothetical protein